MQDCTLIHRVYRYSSVILTLWLLCHCRAAGNNSNELAQIPLRQKLGQLFMLAFDGHQVSAEMRSWLRNRHLGGIALFRKNVKSEGELKQLTNKIQRLSQRHSQMPALIATDHEPGGRMEITLGETFAPAQELGKLPQKALEKKMRNIAIQMASDLDAWGINMNFYPVVDVDVQSAGERGPLSYRMLSHDPKKVSQAARVFIKTLQNRRIAAVAKHYPGHGATTLDSHKGLPRVKAGENLLRKRHWPPFQAAIKADVAGIMTAHLQYLNLATQKPATFSKYFLKDKLRSDWNYQGVVITDDLTMGAVHMNYSLPEAALQALKAGADILLICQRNARYATPEKVYDYLVKKIHSGAIDIQRINEAYRRVAKLKNWLGN